MNTLLITGGAGFIGSHVVRAALSKGLRVINVDALTYSGSLSNLADIADNPNYHFVHQNICDRAAMDFIFTTHRPSAVMHLAAESHVDRSIDGPAEFVQTNIVGTSILLEAARQFWDRLGAPDRAAFRFHHISTDEVYGDLNPEDPAFTEATPYAPSSPYSASKAASDHLVRAWGRTYGLPILISNCSNNYGPNQFPEKLIPVVILKALSSSPIPVYGNGENIRDWLYVEDHADALLTVLTRGTVGETYNIGGDNERTNIDIVRTICAVMDDRLGGSPRADLIEFVTDRPGHDRRYAVNAGKLRRELGWSPSISADAGFAQTVDWYLNHRDWWAPLVKDASILSRLGLKASSS